MFLERRRNDPGRLGLLPNAGDTVNLNYVRNAAGKAQVDSGAVVCRAPHSFPLPNGFRALPVTELE
ncbi:MAG: hypothetical protein ACLQGT_06460 [Terracidiphilus sp.]